MSEEHDTLNFQLSEKGSLVVISFEGGITRTSAGALDECRSALAEKNPRCVVLNFQGVPQMDFKGVSSLIQLKKSLRDSGVLLKLCNLSRRLVQMLDEKGGLRRNELTTDLVSAISECATFVQQKHG